MDIWAKVSSIIIIFSFIFSIIYTVYLGFGDLTSGGQGIIIFLIALLMVLFIFGFFTLFYFVPLFYFAWGKKKKNKTMKIWAKISTILYGATIIVLLISYLENKIGYCPYCNTYTSSLMIPSILLLVLIAPLFYYGWKKDKRNQ